jgi:hypothetical protein
MDARLLLGLSVLQMVGMWTFNKDENDLAQAR